MAEVAPRWERSSDKHGVPRRDQVHVLLNTTYIHEPDEPVDSGRIVLYIGYEHAQTDRELEILVHECPGTSREAVIFHAMNLGPKFRRFREEPP